MIYIDYYYYKEEKWKNPYTQTSHTENIPYALKNQPKLDIKIHSRTPLPAQSAHPKGRQIVHETLQ